MFAKELAIFTITTFAVAYPEEDRVTSMPDMADPFGWLHDKW